MRAFDALGSSFKALPTFVEAASKNPSINFSPGSFSMRFTIKAVATHSAMGSCDALTPEKRNEWAASMNSLVRSMTVCDSTNLSSPNLGGAAALPWPAKDRNWSSGSTRSKNVPNTSAACSSRTSYETNLSIRCSALRTASRQGAARGHLRTLIEFWGRLRANSRTCVSRAGVSQALPPKWTQARANAASSSEGKACATLSATMPGRFTKRAQHGGFDDSGSLDACCNKWWRKKSAAPCDFRGHCSDEQTSRTNLQASNKAARPAGTASRDGGASSVRGGDRGAPRPLPHCESGRGGRGKGGAAPLARSPMRSGGSAMTGAAGSASRNRFAGRSSSFFTGSRSGSLSLGFMRVWRARPVAFSRSLRLKHANFRRHACKIFREFSAVFTTCSAMGARLPLALMSVRGTCSVHFSAKVSICEQSLEEALPIASICMRHSCMAYKHCSLTCSDDGWPSSLLIRRVNACKRSMPTRWPDSSAARAVAARTTSWIARFERPSCLTASSRDSVFGFFFLSSAAAIVSSIDECANRCARAAAALCGANI
mmetsp:Transcript_10729/g.28308  ORF Transcript_10729/g.28308 Transcript_10729/m.28308 type:complete len:542 (+) Transcript_10729:530-2155(+)